MCHCGGVKPEKSNVSLNPSEFLVFTRSTGLSGKGGPITFVPPKET